MLSLVAIVVLYYLGSVVINYVFSVNLCGFASLVSNNFECGFLSSLSAYIRFKFNYWLVISNFILFELEVVLSIIYIFTIGSYFVYVLFVVFLMALLFDLFYD